MSSQLKDIHSANNSKSYILGGVLPSPIDISAESVWMKIGKNQVPSLKTKTNKVRTRNDMIYVAVSTYSEHISTNDILSDVINQFAMLSSMYIA